MSLWFWGENIANSKAWKTMRRGEHDISVLPWCILFQVLFLVESQCSSPYLSRRHTSNASVCFLCFCFDWCPVIWLVHAVWIPPVIGGCVLGLLAESGVSFLDAVKKAPEPQLVVRPHPTAKQVHLLLCWPDPSNYPRLQTEAWLGIGGAKRIALWPLCDSSLLLHYWLWIRLLRWSITFKYKRVFRARSIKRQEAASSWEPFFF